MKEMKGIHRGTFEVSGEALLIKGMIYGDVLIGPEADVEMRGMVFGNLVQSGGNLHIRGIVDGNVTNTGGTLRVTGIVSGRLTTHGGTTTREPKAIVSG